MIRKAREIYDSNGFILASIITTQGRFKCVVQKWDIPLTN